MVASPNCALLVGKTVPRLFTPPLRDLDDPDVTRGHEAIGFAEQVLGIRLFPWQKWLLLHLLELNEDETFRFRTALVLMGRQNGKTLSLLVLFLWRLYVDGAGLVIGTAQNLDIAEETWASAVDLAEGVPELAAEIAHVDRTNGKKALKLTRGERYKVATASRRGGRSLSGDFVGLDELREHQTWESWAAVTKTTMARPKAQVLGLSNAGDSKSVVLDFLRTKALAAIESGSDPSLGIFEWSAADDCDLDDRDGWAQANPSLGFVELGWEHSLTEAAITSAMETDPEPVFRTEVLCQWVDGVTPMPIPLDAWARCCDLSSRIVKPTVLAVDVSPNRSTAAIAVAGRTPLGRPQVEITGRDGQLDWRPGVEWVLPQVVEIARRNRIRSVVLDATVARSLQPALAAQGLTVLTVGPSEMAGACGQFHDAVMSGQLVHRGQLDEVLPLAKRRDVGDSGWAWGRRRSSGDITPLVAVTLALWGLGQVKPSRRLYTFS